MSAPRCPWCGSEEAGMLLGDMGILQWFRCRFCGGDFNRKRKGF